MGTYTIPAPDGGQWVVSDYLNYSYGIGLPLILGHIDPATPAMLAPSSVAASTGVNPTETSYSLYGHSIPLSVFGVGRIGGEIIAGPWVENGLASFIISFGVPADPAGTRDLREIAFDSEVVWTAAGGFTVEAFTYRFYGGTLTQAADTLETTHFGTEANAYRPQILLAFSNLPLAGTKFGKIPYVAAVIGDATGDDVNFGEAFERLAYSPWVGWTSAQFETTGITDGVTSGGLIIAQEAQFLSLIQQFGRFYPKWDILQTDKLRIRDRGSTVNYDIALDKTMLSGAVVMSRAEPNSVPKVLELSTIDPDSDYTIIPSRAQTPLAPVAVSTSVKTESAYLPVIMDAATRASVVTYTKYHEEVIRKKVSFTAMAAGLEIEPGDFVAIVDLGDDFRDEVFRVIETLHGANYVVEATAESILRCDIGFVLDGLVPSAAWSFSRALSAGYLGPIKTVSGGFVTNLYDQSGNGYDLNQIIVGRQPASTTAGPNSIVAGDFDGSNDFLTTGLTASHFISANAGYMIASIYIDAFTTNSASSWANAIILGDGGSGFARMTARLGNIFYAFNWDGNEDKAQGVINVATAYVVEWRHEGGLLYQRVNGAGETSVASGNTSTLGSGSMMMGGVDATLPLSGKVFEAITFSTVPTLAQRDALVQFLGTYIGASV